MCTYIKGFWDSSADVLAPVSKRLVSPSFPPRCHGNPLQNAPHFENDHTRPWTLVQSRSAVSSGGEFSCLPTAELI